MRERWRWVRNYRGRYKVSTHGRVKSIYRKVRRGRDVLVIRPRILKQYINPLHGYAQVILSKKGVQRMHRVHRLVLEAFVGPCPPGMECRHFPDRTKTNNYLINLSWGTHKQNLQDRLLDGFDQTGPNNHNYKLTEAEVRRGRRLKARGYSVRKRALLLGVSTATIHRRGC